MGRVRGIADEEGLVRRAIWIAAGLLWLGALCGAAIAEGLPAGMGEYVLGLLYKGPKWSADSSDETKRLLAGHLESIQKMVAAGTLAFAGPTDGTGDLRGVFVFNLKSVREAEEVVKADPAIRAGRLRAEFHMWYAPAGLATIVKPPTKK